MDPYIFSGSANNATSIAAEFMSSLQSSVTHVHFIYDGGKVTNKIKKIILEKCSNRHIHVSVQATDAVHDRVWIADRREGIIVGTSFNGLGRKISFLVPLPPADFREFLNCLDTLGLSRA